MKVIFFVVEKELTERAQTIKIYKLKAVFQLSLFVGALYAVLIYVERKTESSNYPRGLVAAIVLFLLFLFAFKTELFTVKKPCKSDYLIVLCSRHKIYVINNYETRDFYILQKEIT